MAVSARLLRPAEVPGRSRAGPGRPVGRPEMRYRFGQAWSAERGGEQGARTADLGGGGPEFTASGVPRETFWPGDLAFSPRWRPSPPSRSSHVNHGHEEIPDRCQHVQSYTCQGVTVAVAAADFCGGARHLPAEVLGRSRAGHRALFSPDLFGFFGQVKDFPAHPIHVPSSSGEQKTLLGLRHDGLRHRLHHRLHGRLRRVSAAQCPAPSAPARPPGPAPPRAVRRGGPWRQVIGAKTAGTPRHRGVGGRGRVEAVPAPPQPPEGSVPAPASPPGTPRPALTAAAPPGTRCRCSSPRARW